MQTRFSDLRRLIKEEMQLLKAVLPAESKIEIPVPIHHQTKDYSCGAAALASVVLYWKQDAREWEYEDYLMKMLRTSTEEGTNPRDIVRVAQEHGLNAFYEVDMSLSELKSHLKSGHTVIVCMQAWSDEEDDGHEVDWEVDWLDGHYVVLVGMDEEYAYFMDPSTHASYTYVKIGDLLRRWHDIDMEAPLQHLAIPIWGGNDSEPMSTFPGSLQPLN